MLYLLPSWIRDKYGPQVRLIAGLVVAILGITVLGKIALVVGAALIIWGVFGFVNRSRSRRVDR
jgi:hypothetical protein